MTKHDLIRKVAEEEHLSYVKAQGIVDHVFSIVTDCLREGDSVKIRGFGTFSIGARTERRFKNPKTGKEITLKPSKKVMFAPGNHLKSYINGGD